MRNLLIIILFFVCSPLMAFNIDPLKIDVYVSPYFNSDGPDIKIGEYSKGLSSKDNQVFLITIWEMKDNWSELSPLELHVGAIELYNNGYLDESVLWFYTAQLKANIFKRSLDKEKIGSVGNPAFELQSAHYAFYQLAGSTINGYAFSDISKLKQIVQSVMNVEIELSDYINHYNGLSFVSDKDKDSVVKKVKEDFKNFIGFLETKEEQIRLQRKESGIDIIFKNIKSKTLTRI